MACTDDSVPVHDVEDAVLHFFISSPFTDSSNTGQPLGDFSDAAENRKQIHVLALT